jgi:type IX secretion system PorP/SprF family membrane protein
MKNFTKTLILGVLLVSMNGLDGLSQQLPQFSQYMFNSLHINPGYAGYKNEGYVHASYRNQWLGFPGAPKTMTLTAELSLNEGKTGAGISVLSDKIGATETKMFLATYARRIQVSKYSFLGLGMSSGFSQYSLDGTKLKMNDVGDVLLPPGVVSKTVPNLNIGVFYNSEKVYLGISAYNLIGKSQLKTRDYVYTEHDRHYFFTGGGLVRVNKEVQFKPSFLVKHVKGSPTSVDLNAMFLLNNKVWVGGSYRTNTRVFGDMLQVRKELNTSTALVGIAEIFVTKDLRVGYSFDYNLNILNTRNASSHEISLGYYLRRTVTENNSQKCFF